MGRKGGAPDNLKPFVKGDPRINREGRPPLLPELKEILEKILAEEKDGMTALEAVLKALRNKAIKGDVRAIQEILDRYYGKSKQDVSVALSNDGTPIIIFKDFTKDNEQP